MTYGECVNKKAMSLGCSDFLLRTSAQVAQLHVFAVFSSINFPFSVCLRHTMHKRKYAKECHEKASKNYNYWFGKKGKESHCIPPH
jgi:hypothetical protein